ncbi:hypothetical protein RUND412_006226 [Rhizina undulata]
MPSSIWITDDVLRRAFVSFSRRFTRSLPPCMSSLQHKPKILSRRVSGEALGHWEDLEIEAIASGLFDEAPPSFSWSVGLRPIDHRAGVKVLETDSYNYMATQASKPLVYDPWSSPYYASKPKAKSSSGVQGVMSSFFESILQPISPTSASPSEITPIDSQPVLRTIPSLYARELLAELEEALRVGKKSVHSMVASYREIKHEAPTLYLSSTGVMLFLRSMLELHMYPYVVQVMEKEELISGDIEKIFKNSLENVKEDQKRKILADLMDFCSRANRPNLVKLFKSSSEAIFGDAAAHSKNEKKLPINRTTMEEPDAAKRIEGERDLEFRSLIMKSYTVFLLQQNIAMIAGNLDTKISIATSRAIFQRFVHLNAVKEGIDHLFFPEINIPGSNNIATLCGACCELDKKEIGFQIIKNSLKFNVFNLVSSVDLQEGLRCVVAEEQLIWLWELVKESKSILIRDITPVALGRFIGRACQMNLGNRDQWIEMNGETPLLAMCVDIIIRSPEKVKEAMVSKIATLLEVWVWEWRVKGDDTKQRTNMKTLEYGIPYMSRFLQTLPVGVADSALGILIQRVVRNCIRKEQEIWPLAILWPLVSTVAQTPALWKNEESLGIFFLERTLLKKDFATQYLAFRTDEAIARFVARHYLPFRISKASLQDLPTVKADAQNILIKLRDLEELYIRKNINVFAVAILAFRGTSIPIGTLVPDMVFTLYKLNRVDDIVAMLRVLSQNEISMKMRFWAYLIRTITPKYPVQALELLKIYPRAQYSVYAYFIAVTARDNPKLAMKAYRIFTRPQFFNHRTATRHRAVYRRPKERLLVAMAYKFARSPQLSTRQALRAVQYLLRAMMFRPPYKKNKKLAKVFAAVVVGRREMDGVNPLGERLKWALKQIAGQDGKEKEIEVANMAARVGLRIRRTRAIGKSLLQR